MNRSATAALFLLLAATGASGYIRASFSYSDGTTAFVKRSDAAMPGVQFYFNSLIAPGLQSSVSGSSVTVISSGSDPLGAMRAALNTWNVAPNSSARFLPLLSTTKVNNPNEGQNTIAVVSTAADLSMLGFVSAASPGAFAVTLLSGAPSVPGMPAGDVADTDILINPAFAFSTDFSTTVDLQAVVTHELGHSLGLSHSNLVGATMFQYTYLAERYLSVDEMSFAAAIYPAKTSSLGGLKGRVITSDGSPVQNGLVTVMDTTAGNVLGALTAADGTWSLQLPAGSYIMYADPITGSSLVQAANLYIPATTKITSGYQATVLGGIASPTVLSVTSGNTTTAPDLTVTPGTSALTSTFAGLGKAGGKSDFRTFTNTALIVPSGQSVDIGLATGGIDGSISVRGFGAGLTVHPGVVTDPGVVNGQPIVRVTIDLAPVTAPTLASFIVTKGSSVLAMTGFLVIVPPTPTISAVQDAESSLPTIVPGEWVAIYGSDLATGVNVWAGVDFVNGNYLPVTLAGVRVQFNGSPAPVYVATSGQLNVQAPSNLSGNVSVVVTNNGSPSAPFIAKAVPIAPSLFYYPSGGKIYPAAVHINGTLVGDSAPAKPGETILFFANGLDSSTGGVLLAAPVTYTNPVTMTIGGMTSTASYAGLVGPGEYQLNVAIPSGLANGTYPITITNQGQTSPSGMVIPVSN